VQWPARFLSLINPRLQTSDNRLTEATQATAAAVKAKQASEAATLDRNLVRGIVWTGAGKWGSQVLSWASTLIVARLLTPADYGVVGMAMIYLALITLLSEFGVGAAVINLQKLSHDQIAQLNTVSLLVGAVSFVLSCAMAKPLGYFFHAPQVAAVVVVTSTGFLISAAQTVPYSLLQKDLRFKLLAGIEAFRAIVTAAAAIVMAFMGLGYWTLVLGGLLGTLLATILTVAARPERFAVPRFSQLREALSYSNDILITRFAWYAFSNGDFLVAGRMLGGSALGNYTLAWSIASVPVEKVTALISRVGPAFFSAVQHDKSELRRYLAGLTEMLALIVFPVTAGLGLVSSDLVRVVFGPKWTGAILPLSLLSVAMAVRSITPLLPFVLNVVKETRFSMWNSVAASLILPLGFYLGSHWGTGGIACVWATVYPILMIPLFVRTLSRIDMRKRDYLRSIWPPLSSCMLMMATVLLVSHYVPSYWTPPIRLAIKVTTGAVSYAGAVLLLHRQALDRIRTAAKMLRSV